VVTFNVKPVLSKTNWKILFLTLAYDVKGAITETPAQQQERTADFRPSARGIKGSPALAYLLSNALRRWQGPKYRLIHK
jgi:hypothetical protein